MSENAPDAPAAELSVQDGGMTGRSEREPRIRRTRAERRREMRGRLKDANFSAAIYGQIIVLSLLAVLGGHGEQPSAETVLATVISSQLVFWIAHAYAEILSRQITSSTRIARRDVGHVMEHEWPLVQAAGPTVVLMVLSLLGVLEVNTGVDIAIGLGVVQLFGWGYISARRLPPLLRLLAGTTSGALGVLIVLLKVLIH